MTHNFSLLAFPAAGDVGRADADINHTSAKHAWTNGIRYSNGNRMIRHLGIPTVTVPMGVLGGEAGKGGKEVPMGLTFAGAAYSDEKLLRWAKAFEGMRERRMAPGLTPVVPDEGASWSGVKLEGQRPELLLFRNLTPPHLLKRRMRLPSSWKAPSAPSALLLQQRSLRLRSSSIPTRSLLPPSPSSTCLPKPSPRSQHTHSAARLILPRRKSQMLGTRLKRRSRGIRLW